MDVESGQEQTEPVLKPQGLSLFISYIVNVAGLRCFPVTYMNHPSDRISVSSSSAIVENLHGMG